MYVTFTIQPNTQEGKERKLVVISTYGSTNCKYDGDITGVEKSEVKDKFWDKLEETLTDIPRH